MITQRTRTPYRRAPDAFCRLLLSPVTRWEFPEGRLPRTRQALYRDSERARWPYVARTRKTGWKGLQARIPTSGATGQQLKTGRNELLRLGMP